jgi:hypothetical protein
VATAGGNNDDGRHPKWLVPSVCPLGYPRRRPEASHVGIPCPDPSSGGQILGCNPGERVTERGARKGGGTVRVGRRSGREGDSLREERWEGRSVASMTVLSGACNFLKEELHPKRLVIDRTYVRQYYRKLQYDTRKNLYSFVYLPFFISHWCRNKASKRIENEVTISKTR